MKKRTVIILMNPMIYEVIVNEKLILLLIAPQAQMTRQTSAKTTMHLGRNAGRNIDGHTEIMF